MMYDQANIPYSQSAFEVTHHSPELLPSMTDNILKLGGKITNKRVALVKLEGYRRERGIYGILYATT